MVSKKELDKAEVQNCVSLSSVGRLLQVNLGAKLSKLCMARSKNLLTTRARERTCKLDAA